MVSDPNPLEFGVSDQIPDLGLIRDSIQIQLDQGINDPI